jgi:VWFA-related protein
MYFSNLVTHSGLTLADRGTYTSGMTHAARGFSTLLVVCALASGAHGQTPSRGADVRTRDIYVSVVDNRGAPVTGLTAADFAVKEDGTVREVLEVKPADAPMQIALLIDDSTAASDATTYLRDGLAAFLERMRGKAEIGLITVGDRPTVLAPYTTDTEVLNQRVRRIFPRTNSGAYLLDAITDASKALAKREATRPVILAITFEGIEHSNQHHDVVLRELMKSGAALHVIAIGTPSGSTEDEMRSRGLVLSEGTARTGGRRDQVLAVSGIPDKLKQAADELLNQYIVTYGRPDKLIPPEKITVTSTRKGVTVRARTRLTER